MISWPMNMAGAKIIVDKSILHMPLPSLDERMANATGKKKTAMP